eukprot:Lankesteria_metandrocarpae@DN5209_c0_g1_i6.p1
MQSDGDASSYSLQDVTVTVDSGQLVAITGAVGSGKSAFCEGLIGELSCSASTSKHSGRTFPVSIYGRVAYVPQTPWLLNASVRSNILFGRKYNPRFYNRVLEACCLVRDLESLSESDKTEIGERGMTLSGGQKQRICLARAVYADADVYILDDPLSAVDPDICHTLFKECLSNEPHSVLFSKTRLLVTQEKNVISKCDRVLVVRLDNCDASQASTGVVVEPHHCASTVACTEVSPATCDSTACNSVGEDVPTRSTPVDTKGVVSCSTDAMVDCRESPHAHELDEASAMNHIEDRLITNEERAVGPVALRIYIKYISEARSILLLVFLLFCLLFWMAANLMTNFWLSFWTDDSSYQRMQLGAYAGVLAAVAMAVGLASFLSTAALNTLGIRTSSNLHNRMAHVIFHAPLRFFDTTPMGRVLSRFSRDLDLMDSQLLITLCFLLNGVLDFLSAVVCIVIALPWFLIPLPFLGTIYVFLCNFYRKSLRELKRLEAVTRSPIYSHFQETLFGLSSIRAYQACPRFLLEAECLVDRNNRMYLLMRAIERWLAIRLDFLGALFILVTSCIAAATRGSVAPSFAGVAITCSTAVLTLLIWIVRNFSEVEAAMNCVERVLHYSSTTHIGQESSVLLPECSLALTTSHGVDQLEGDSTDSTTLQFNDVWLKYGDRPTWALKGMSFRINNGAKVGVCGRSGSGKSSIVAAVTRIVEIEEGKILFYGRNTAAVPLEELRKRLTVVQQDPVLFSGSLRFNMDPTDAHSDAELMDALATVGLLEVVQQRAAHCGGHCVDMDVAEAGSNFSVGQRQLICLARALLRKPEVVLLDEATSAMDTQTDIEVQRVIRTAFRDITVIIIAHRLLTIMDTDVLLVVEVRWCTTHRKAHEYIYNIILFQNYISD